MTLQPVIMVKICKSGVSGVSKTLVTSGHWRCNRRLRPRSNRQRLSSNWFTFTLHSGSPLSACKKEQIKYTWWNYLIAKSRGRSSRFCGLSSSHHHSSWVGRVQCAHKWTHSGCHWHLSYADVRAHRKNNSNVKRTRMFVLSLATLHYIAYIKGAVRPLSSRGVRGHAPRKI